MKYTRRIRLDRIGSATSPAKLNNIAEVSPEIDCREGAIIAVRALSDKHIYGEMELPNGRMAKVVQGNLMACVLGARQALHGYMGHVPTTLAQGDEISLLNIGGVAGIVDAPNKDLGAPIRIEVLGQIIREGVPLNIQDYALPPCATLSAGAPLILILGTCMNSGKTYAAAEIIRVLTRGGIKVAAGKLSGVAALKDLMRMQDNGAIATTSFLDCGLPSTVNATDLGSVARAVVQHLDRSQPDAILLELGDGIIGGYNTGSILRDPQILARTRARVLCASDLVGAWGGAQILQPLSHLPDVMSSPVTDNAVGTSWITREMQITCANARLEPEALARAVADAAGLKIEELG